MKKKIRSVLTAVILVMSLVLPVQAAENKERFIDNAGLLGIEEEQELSDTLDEISERQKMDVVILTVNSLDGYTATEYADDYFDYNGYGYGEGRDGILLLVSMGERKWAVSTSGYAQTVFTSAGNDYLEEQIVGHLSDGDFYKAFKIFAGKCDDFIEEAKTGSPYDVGHMPKKPVNIMWIIFSMCGGFLIAFLIALWKKSRLKSVIEMRDAQEYIEPGSMNLTSDVDRFVNRVTTTRRIETENRSGGGGSDSHISSSGRSHGGSSGSF